MKRIIFFLTVIFCSFLVQAQTETDIRAHYIAVNKQIDESVKEGFEGPLYKNQWITNSTGKSWPAVGNFTDTTNFWYDDTPDHLPAKERDPKKVLLKVTVNRKASHLTSNEEFLFKDGKLIFYFNHGGEEGTEWEIRVYFDNKGVAFKTGFKVDGREFTMRDFANEKFKSLKPEPAKLLAEAKKFQDMFIQSML